MEDLFPVVIVIIGSIASIVSSSMKAKQQKAATEWHKAAAAARVKAAQQMQTAQRQTQPITAPATPVVDVPAQAITPTVHPHLTPDCETHDTAGSLAYVSAEGKDPCHEEQLTHVRTPEETDPQEQGGLTFDWTGSSMVKAIVMQEVLTRPAQRRAR